MVLQGVGGQDTLLTPLWVYQMCECYQLGLVFCLNELLLALKPPLVATRDPVVGISGNLPHSPWFRQSPWDSYFSDSEFGVNII